MIENINHTRHFKLSEQYLKFFLNEKPIANVYILLKKGVNKNKQKIGENNRKTSILNFICYINK